MIKFKNVAGDSFIAVGTIQRKFALNGEKSLSGVLYDGDDVINNIDKGWSLEFDGEPYVVSYFERNDSDNTLSFDAVHKFFWVMSKSVLYSETSGSHTIKWYLDQIFANTGYSYALNFNPNAIAKDSWGMKTKLSLFNDIISSVEGEFEINGTLISIFEKVGSDLSTIVRYGFNLSDMSIENDAAGFVTYGEGFGAYEDQQNQSGPRLHATYTSPLASVYGILQAEPVDDQRYTLESSIIGAIKAKVDSSFSVSIKLSLYDLTAAGYPYKVAHVGDWLMAIDEKLDFKQRIRIISIDDEFDANGNRISYTVTAGNIGVVQKYQEANASLSSQVSNALDTASKASDDANIALISANGKNTSYYVDSVDTLPAKANEGDMGWVQSGDGRVLYIYKKKPDGTFYWEKRIDPEMGEQIAAGVNKAVTDAKTYSDQLVATNREQVDAVLDDVQAKQADLTSQQAELDTKAQGYANKALADAKADTLATATQTAKDAQEYTDTAKAEAISVATTADGVINKKIDDTASSITRTISQNKSDADGKILTAQSTATQALDGLTQKVSQNIYDAKVNELTGKISTAQQTADGVVTTVGNYQTSNDKRVSDAESKIEQNSKDITTRVSQFDYNQKTGELSGYISTLKQRADSFDSTVTKVDNLAVGGRNLYLNSRALADGYGTNGNVTVTVEPFDSTTNMWHIVAPQRTGAGIGIYIWNYAKVKIPDNSDWSYSAYVKGTGKVLQFGIELGNKNPVIGNIGSEWSRISQTGHVNEPQYKTIIMYFDTTDSPLDVYIKLPKLETGNVPTDWTPAPEDTDNKISTVSQTVDSISSIVSDPTTGLTKRVQTAEGTLSQVTGADIPNLQKATYWQPFTSLDLNTYTKQGSFFFNSTAVKPNGPTTKTNWMYLVVEQGTSDSGRVVQTAWYDTQTEAKITYRRQYAGDWSPWYANDNDSVTTISQTNGAIKQEISDRQNGDTNTLTQAKDFTTSSISNSESGMRSQITQTSDAILGKVGAVNLFPNSEFEKDYGYRQKDGNTSLSLDHKDNVDGRYNGTVQVISTSNNYQGYWARNIPVYGGQKYSMSVLVHYTNGGLSDGWAAFDVWFVDKEGNRISAGDGGNRDNTTGQVSSPWWVKLYAEGITAPKNAAYVQVSLIVNDAGAGQTAVFTQPMVTATEKLQKYAVNNDITTQLALLKDNWSIGIADNAGAITSGIVGNSSNMSLISNNVTINSPQTQIKGTAWINSAMIGNGQIGTAQIGDLSVTSAKISSLDVDKLTGNVSNWVLSQWTSATGNKVTIDGNGLYFSPGTSRMTTYGFEAWRRESSGNYAAMGMLGSYAWETDQDINGVGLIAKYYGVPHDDPNGPWKNEVWGGDTIAIGALEPQIGRGYNYVTPYMIFPSSSGIGGKYFPGNGNDTIIMSRWLSIYTGLNMRGHSIVNSSGYSLKENFSPVSGSDALDIFDNTEIMTYDYKPDSDDIDARTLANMQDKVGFVINDNGESPFKTDPRLVRYGNTRDDSVTVGYLMAAVKELHAKVKELTTKLEAQK